MSVVGSGAEARADVVTDWNGALLDSVRAARTTPPQMTRNAALLNVSMYDAVVAITGGFERYLVTGAAPAGASAQAAAAAAAHRVLSERYPADVARFDALRATHLAALADATAAAAGVAWGEQVAAAVHASRANDGAATAVTYVPPLGALWWLPTPAAFAPALLPNWPQVKPWAMESGAQFRAAGPPPTPSDGNYAADFEEVKRLGQNTSTTRTAEQTEIALFWNDGAGTATPPGHWNLIAKDLAEDMSLPLVETARLFALLSITSADAAIVAWDNKYHYHNWRPVSGIRSADIDGNPGTFADAAWTSLIPTPPFPSYTSGHSTFSGAAARLLALYFNDDELSFSTGADGAPGVVRSFDRFSQAAEEAGQSRIFGGIHWQYDNRDALAAGRALAEYVFANTLRPTTAAATACVPDESTLCLHAGRFSLRADWRSSPTVTGLAFAAGRTDTSGEFAFFHPDNLELLVKLLDGCAINGHYWLFAAGATDLEYVLVATDHETNSARTYFNPLRTPGRATRDVEAFPCP